MRDKPRTSSAGKDSSGCASSPGKLMIRRLINLQTTGNIYSMAKHTKSVLDAGWGQLKAMLEYKCDHAGIVFRSEEHTSELQSRPHLVCRLLLEKKKITSRRNSASTTSSEPYSYCS